MKNNESIIIIKQGQKKIAFDKDTFYSKYYYISVDDDNYTISNDCNEMSTFVNSMNLDEIVGLSAYDVARAAFIYKLCENIPGEILRNREGEWIFVSEQHTIIGPMESLHYAIYVAVQEMGEDSAIAAIERILDAEIYFGKTIAAIYRNGYIDTRKIVKVNGGDIVNALTEIVANCIFEEDETY